MCKFHFLRLRAAAPAAGAALVALAALTLNGCVVGPDYRGAPDAAPNAKSAAHFNRAPPQGVSDAPAVADWWNSLGDPQLNALIETALEKSPGIRIAQARLRQARAGLALSRRNALPKASARALALRMRSPDTSALLGPSGGAQNGSAGQGGSQSSGRGPLQLYDIGFDATWEADLFGGVKRAVEAASADAEASQANLDDAHVSLAAEVAQNYVDLRDLQLRLALQRQSADLEQKMLALSEQRRARGAASDADIERLRTQLETTQATLIPLDAQIGAALDALAVLTGREPGALDPALRGGGPLPSLPATVAIGNPADVIRQRPDIRAAERQLASRNAQIGTKVAARFPKLTLIGDIGYSAADPAHLLRKDSFTWAGLPYLSWNFLDFGRNRSAVKQAEAGYDEAEAQYRSTVLNALKDAETALSRYGHQRANLESLMKVQTMTAQSVAYAEQRYQAGAISLIDRYDSQRSGLAAQQNAVAGQAELIKDFVSLQKSLGLGWQHCKDCLEGKYSQL
ncbi:efflux transporter outer membrane subunit [Oxalobacteraceae bacterium CAVE-383]|nr:efflux transporter outer membrane subunit [Oxalobacteraceae bacterium CAVE-383]